MLIPLKCVSGEYKHLLWRCTQIHQKANLLRIIWIYCVIWSWLLVCHASFQCWKWCTHWLNMLKGEMFLFVSSVMPWNQ
jgi:hypothetical protein